MSTPPVKHYQKLKERYPGYFDALESLGEATRRAGPLDGGTVQLLQLTAAVALRSEGAVHSHTRRALEDGATADEVRHAILLLTSTVGFPNVMAALSWAEDVIGE